MSTQSPIPQLQRSVTPNRDIPQFDGESHWSKALYECEVYAKVDGTFDFIVEGGSDNGEFPFFGTTYYGGFDNIAKHDILLEIQGQKVAGYTQRDIISWLAHCSRNGNFVKVKAVKAGFLTKDLRQYLNGRFQKGSLDHDLQNTIRDNLYLRTVPCTTRTPRCGEINGVDYTFLSVEEFIALERSGNLLESGIYEGNLYGTPRPAPAASAFSASISNLVQNNGWSPVKNNPYGTSNVTKDNNPHSPAKRNNSIGSGNSSIFLPGAHASSEGKRRRNRSNVEAMASKTSDVSEYAAFNHIPTRSSTPISSLPKNGHHIGYSHGPHLNPNEADNNSAVFSRPFVANGQAYFIKNHPTPHWLDSRLSRVPPTHVEDFSNNDLPFGWERIDDPHYGTYYIDHVNRRTQYENPVLHASIFNESATSKDFTSRSLSWNSRSEPRSDHGRNLRSPCSDGKISPRTSRNSSLTQTTNRDSLTPANTNSFNTIPKQPAFFTLNPDELKGFFIHIPLIKSSRGLGFTIIGGDNQTTKEFLQIKDVVPYGPAWRDGKMHMGDILVYVNKLCVLGYSHKDVISLFQSIPAGNVVHLEVCRGYPLPFDPNDPNNEIVTTVAVSIANAKGTGGNNVYSTSQPSSNSKLTSSAQANCAESKSRAAKSLPDLSLSYNGHRFMNAMMDSSMTADRYSVEIVKGTAGFGFTIADSAYGQKVKKILDRPRCKHLQEGVILSEINGREVQNLPHAEVVQILKDCPIGDSARITVQRGHFPSLPMNRAKVKDISDDSQPKQRTDFNEPQGHLSSTTSGRDEKFFNGYRSKTPTAELYSTRDKDPVVIPRPKTPLVDSRNWIKSSPSNPAVSFTSSDRLDPDFDYMPNRDKSFEREFKNGAQLDRETTNYLMFEPTHDSQNRKSLWYPKHNTNRLSSSDQSYNDSSFIQNPEAFPNVNDVQTSGIDFQESSSNYFLKNAQGMLNNDNEISGNNYIESQFDGSEFMSQKWTRSDNKTTNHLYSTSPKNSPIDSVALYANQNYHQFPTMTNAHPYPVNESSLSSDPTSHSQNFNGGSLDSAQKKHDTSFELENLMGYNSHDASYYPNSKVDDGHGELAETYMNMVVTLYRQNNGFGFRILGGTEEGSQVSVGHIVPGGAADLDGRLQTGDEILGVDSVSVLNSSHRNVIELMSNASTTGKVTLHVRRPTTNHSNGNSMKIPNSSYEVTVCRNENEGFGFVLISSLNRKGSTIGRIIEGSPADRCNQLYIGDVIEAVNGNSILNMHHGDIVNLIKDCGNSITLHICRFQDNSSSITSSQKCEDSLLDPDESYHSIELQRGTKGFGFSIRGGREFHNMPLFVLRIAENGPADQDGRIQVNDQIVEINGVCTKNMTHAEAIDLIREGGQTVRLLVKRNCHSMNMPGTAQLHYLSPLVGQSFHSPMHSSTSATESMCQTSP